MNRPNDESQQTAVWAAKGAADEAGLPPPSDQETWSNLPRSALDAVDRICDEFETAWRAGEQPRIEDFVRRVPASMAADLFRQLLNVELELRRKAGQAPLESEYSARFSEQANLVQLVFRSQTTQAAGASSHRLPGGERTAELADYEFIREIARGGMGIVYEARQRSLKRTVALKMILAGQLASEDAVRRFYAEAQAAAGLNHPHIVPVFEVGQESGQHFFSMGYVDGESLAARVAQQGPLPPREAAMLAQQIAEAVDYAHRQGVVHRDLKPQNVLLSRDDKPMVTDFGLAKQLNDVEGLTVSGQLLGTPSFMAPEQAQGRTDQVGPLSDVYALGAILYHLLTGRPPFHTASMVETLKQVIEHEPISPRSLNPEVNRDLETICLKCLQKDPSQRYASAQHMADDLRRFLDGDEILARPISRAEKAWRWCRRRPSTAGLAAVTLLVVVVGIPLGVWYQGQLTASQALTKAAESDRQAAEERASASRQAADAAKQLAATQEYFATVNEARQLIARGRMGWTHEALAKLKHAAKLKTPAHNAAELRSEAASCLTSYDLRPPIELAKGMRAGQVAFSPDGKWLAIGQLRAALLAFCTVLVLDVETGEPVHRLNFTGKFLLKDGAPAPDGCRQLAFSPDRRWLVCGTRTGYLHAWDLQQSPPQYHSWQAHGAELVSLMFAAESNRVYTASETERTVKQWALDGEIGKETHRHLSGHDIHGISCNPHDGRLLIDEADGVTGRLALETFDVLEVREMPLRGSIWCVPRGNLVLVGSRGRMDLLWAVDPAADVRIYQDTRDPSRSFSSIKRAEFSQDGRLMLTVHQDDRKATIWETDTGTLIANIGFEPEAHTTAALDPTGRRLALVGNQRVLLHEIEAHLPPAPLNRGITQPNALSWGSLSAGTPYMIESPFRGATLLETFDVAVAVAAHPAAQRAAASYGDTNAEIWNLSTRPSSSLAKFKLPKVTGLCFSPNGRRLWGLSDQIRVWTRSEGENEPRFHFDNQLQNLMTGRSALLSLAGGDEFALVGTRLGELLKVSNQTSAPERWLLSTAPLSSLALTPAQDLVVCGTESGEVMVVRVADGSIVERLASHDAEVRSVACSPDGQFIASASLDRTLRLWLRSGPGIQALPTWRLPAEVHDVSFHPDSHSLALRVHNELGARVLDLEQLQSRLTPMGLNWSR